MSLRLGCQEFEHDLDVLSRTVFSYYMASRAELTADTLLLPVSFWERVILRGVLAWAGLSENWGLLA